jgi:hypothetical protein
MKGRVGGLLEYAQWSDNYGLVTFTFRIKLQGQWGPRLRRSIHRGWIGLPKRSSWLLSTEVDDSRDGYLRHCFTTLALLGY